MCYGLSGIFAEEPLVAQPRYFREPPLYRLLPAHPMTYGQHPLRVASMHGEDSFALRVPRCQAPLSPALPI